MSELKTVADISPAQVWRRRILFLSSWAAAFVPAFLLMARVLAEEGFTVLEQLALVLFSILFSFVIFGGLLALAGFFVLRRGGDPLRISRTLETADPKAPLPPTAIVVPIYNEDVERVFQRLCAVHESLRRTGFLSAFHIFVLSDSNDPNHWVAEEKMWLHLCKRVNGFGRIFYRKRRVTLNHKSGNVADFCRRWGADYRYMVVFDADSIMTGDLLVKLVRLMEHNPSVGILQTAPREVLGHSLFQRIKQFSGRLYAPLFAVGATFWHSGQGTYWGHNAIIRVKPFMDYCALPELPRVGGLGGRILSHDSVEAAFMCRAGYEVWCVYDLEGSYEEGPPDLLASLQRDARWCRGNMQHLLLLRQRGLKLASRVHLLIGILAYASAPFWFLFLILTLLVGDQAVSRTFNHSVLSFTLFLYVLSWLFLPKLLGLIHAFRAGRTNPAFARRSRVLLSVVGETALSTLLAPVLMLSYTRFVFGALTGLRIQWGRQNRGEDRPTWRECARALGWHTLFGVGAFIAFALLSPKLLPWLAPLLAGWWLAVPFARITSSSALGERARAAGLFLTPEEASPPPELVAADERMVFPESPFFQQAPYVIHYGLLQAVLDPYINAIHVSLLRWRQVDEESDRPHLETLRKQLLIEGPAGLRPDERNLLLWDPDSMVKLHQELWICVTEELAEWWRLALRNYNATSAAITRRRFGAT